MTDHAHDIRVITFNTAAGNPRITTPQQAFLELPFYRAIFEDAPGAAILALQEVGAEQAAALARAAAGGRFALVRIARPGQANVLLIPGRYTVLSSRSRFFVTSQLLALVRALLRALTRRAQLDVRQYLELRMWSSARLRDSISGDELTVFNTHLSGEPALRLAQARTLLRRVHRARRAGPVVLAGDLNVRASAGSDPVADEVDAAVRELFSPLQDMAVAARDSPRPAIDWILAAGVQSAGSRLYTGADISLPGSPTAELVSDHYAKEAILRPA